MTRTSRIRILPEETINKVAAGEVVERPAAVVKELVENSLDAGARQIDIALEQSGRSLIRVRDDGAGMSHDEVLLALERHSTSKIGSVADLDRIGTFGFRGEALPSIAAVSRMQITSRTGGEREGTRVLVESGAVRRVTPCGAPVGTEIEVRNLFRNIPARLKFLRSGATELSHCLAAASRIALANPAVGFTVSHGPRTLLRLAPAADERTRLGEHLDEELYKSLLPFSRQAGGTTARGFVVRPGCGRPGADYQQLFVNRRPVRDPVIAKGIREACRDYFQGGRSPISWFVWIDTPPEEVDVNVHPTKREVRFRNPGAPVSLLAAAIRETLRSDRLSSFGPSTGPTSPGTAEPVTGYTPARPPKEQIPLVAPDQHGADLRTSGEEGMQVFGTYLVVPRDEGLLLVDQHAAHERVTFERVLDILARGKPQRLLQPVLVELSAGEAEILDEVLPAIGNYGIEVERFGPRAFRLLSLPLELSPDAATAFLREVVGRLGREDALPAVPEYRRELAALLACHGSVRASRRLRPEEVRTLLKDLFSCEDPAHCPHGRPTFITIDLGEIKRRFGRT